MKFAHPLTLEPEVTGDFYSGLWTHIECTLCVLSMKTIGSDSFFECVIHMEWAKNFVIFLVLYYSIKQNLSMKKFYFIDKEIWWKLNIKKARFAIIFKVESHNFLDPVLAKLES